MSKVYFESAGGGGAQDLQQVTDIGNTTTNVISALSLTLTGIAFISEAMVLVVKEALVLVDLTVNATIIVDMVNMPVGHIVTVKILKQNLANTGRVLVYATGSNIDNQSPYELSLPNEAATFQRITGSRVSVLSPNFRSIGGIHQESAFTGSTFAIFTNLSSSSSNQIAMVQANDSISAQILQGGFHVSYTDTTFTVTLLVPVVAPVDFNVLWVANIYNNNN